MHLISAMINLLRRYLHNNIDFAYAYIILIVICKLVHREKRQRSRAEQRAGKNENKVMKE
jgi:hypothetical protein